MGPVSEGSVEMEPFSEASAENGPLCEGFADIGPLSASPAEIVAMSTRCPGHSTTDAAGTPATNPSANLPTAPTLTKPPKP